MSAKSEFFEELSHCDKPAGSVHNTLKKRNLMKLDSRIDMANLFSASANPSS
jgi:hypothetical protein